MLRKASSRLLPAVRLDLAGKLGDYARMDVEEDRTPPGMPPHASLRPERSTRVWRAISLLLVGVIMVVIFAAYRQPELLVNLVGLRYCG